MPIAIGAVAVILALIFFSQAGKSAIVGTWEITEGSRVGKQVTFMKNGSLYDNGGLEYFLNSYSLVSWEQISGDTMILVDSHIYRTTYTFRYSIRGKTMTLTYDYGNGLLDSLTLKRIS